MYPKIGSVGIMAKAAIVISWAKKAAALLGSTILKSGSKMTIYWVSTISQTEFSNAERLSCPSIGPIWPDVIPALLFLRTTTTCFIAT